MDPSFRDKVAEYIATRTAIITRADPPYRRPTFTIESPHSCSHCQNACLDLSAEEDFYHSKQFSPNIKMHLPYNLGEAIIAAKSGCALYEWLIDFLCDKVQYHYSIPPAASPEPLLFGLWSELLELKAPTELTFTLQIDEPLPLLARPILEHRDKDGNVKGVIQALQPHLFVCTVGGSSLADVIPTRPAELNVTSEKSLSFARRCLEECMTHHLDCQPSGSDASGPYPSQNTLDVDSLPLRIIQVLDEDGSRIRVIEVKELPADELEEICQTGYAILSYCWGGDQPNKLTSDSYKTLRNGLSATSFSRTVQGAVWWTVKIGLKFLWVDALCIFQDKENLKAEEIARMASYYGNASVLLCAASARACSDGFLSPRPETGYSVGPFRLPCKTTDGDGSVLLYHETEPIEPLASRAWTYQESLLSRRLLIFSSRSIYWSCNTANATCGGIYPELKGRINGYPFSLVPGIYPILGLRFYPPLLQWRFIVHEYTRRNLSIKEDKLLAVSALATVVHTTFRKRNAMEVQYVAGLFFDQSNPTTTISQLLWVSATTSAERSSVYRAPSWSWACLDSEVTDVWLPTVGLTTINPPYDESRMRIDEYRIDLVYSNTPYGLVEGGYIQFQGPLISVNSDNISTLPRITFERHPVLTSKDAPFLSLWPDTEIDRLLIQEKLAVSDAVSLLELCGREKDHISLGLILLSFEDKAGHGHKRVGVFVLKGSLKNGAFMFPETKIRSVRVF